MRKKIYYLLFIVILFFSVIKVEAEDYKVNTLIPVDTIASVETDKFEYRNFKYDSAIDSKGNATIKFEGIQNNTLSKTAVSINVLLFDAEYKNIGFLTYCTDKDISSDNAGFKIRPNQVVPFTIPVTTRYFVEGKFPKDVRYIAVRDENRYCQIGGYDNYKGLTLEEINNGVETKKNTFNFPDFSSLVNMSLIIVFFAIVAVVGMVFGGIKLVRYLKDNKGKAPKKVKAPKVKTGKETVPAPVNNVNDEANKPLDLGSLYDNADSLSSVEVPVETKKPTNALDDLYNLDTPVSPATSQPQGVSEDTQAIPVESIYNSISELPELDQKEENNASIDDLYNSINASNSPKETGGTSIEDLYESINVDEDEDDTE